MDLKTFREITKDIDETSILVNQNGIEIELDAITYSELIYTNPKIQFNSILTRKRQLTLHMKQ